MAITYVRTRETEIEKRRFDEYVCREWHRFQMHGDVSKLQGWVRGFAKHQQHRNHSLRKELVLLLRVADCYD